jgi:hypothetical protein
MKKELWITIKYRNDSFDVKWSAIDREIKEIRSVDSEVNIAYLLSLEVKREIQEIIINKGTHHALQRVKANKCQPTY